MIFASQQSSDDCLLGTKDSMKETEKGDMPLVKVMKWHYGLKSVCDTDVYKGFFTIFRITNVLLFIG